MKLHVHILGNQLIEGYSFINTSNFEHKFIQELKALKSHGMNSGDPLLFNSKIKPLNFNDGNSYFFVAVKYNFFLSFLYLHAERAGILTTCLGTTTPKIPSAWAPREIS